MIKYISQREKVIEYVDKLLNSINSDNDLKLNQVIASMCLRGFKKPLILEILSYHEELGAINLDHENNKLISYNQPPASKKQIDEEIGEVFP